MTMGENEKLETVNVEPSKWFIKLRSGPVTPELYREFRDWLQGDPEREAAYERCELAGALIRELESDPELGPMIDHCSKIRKEYEENSDCNQPGFPGWLISHRLSVSTAAFALTTLILAFVINVMPVTYKTGIGELRTVVLEDRSTVTLNTDSEIAVHYSAGSRSIRLVRGEAFFEVARDFSRPFEVTAGRGRVKAVGTAFGVELEGDKVTVSVLEGKVTVTPDIEHAGEKHDTVESLELKGGESLDYWGSGVIAEVNLANKKRITAWREGKLNFDGLRLADAIKEHNRYTSHKIVLGSDDVRNLSISGIFRIGDTESLLYLLEQSLGLKVIKHDKMILLVKPSKSRLADPLPELVEWPASG